MFFVAFFSKFACSLVMVDAVFVYPFHYFLELLDIVVWRSVWRSVWCCGGVVLFCRGNIFIVVVGCVVLFCRGDIIIVVVGSSWVESCRVELCRVDV